MQFIRLCVLRLSLFMVGELNMNNRVYANQGARNQPCLYGFWSGNGAKARIYIVPLGKTRISFYRQEIILSHLPTSLPSFSFQGKASPWRSCCRHRRRKWPPCQRRSRWPWTVQESRVRRQVSTTLPTEDNNFLLKSIRLCMCVEEVN